MKLLHAALGLSLFSLGTLSCGAGTDTTNAGGSGGSGGSTGQGNNGGTGGAVCEPSAEICDGVDNNCDGEVDEGCDCQSGDTQPCYDGPAGTEGVGSCKAGTQSCATNGKFGACEGAVLPGDEICNGKDDDCDGQDDNLPELTCGVGACAATAPACSNGQDGQCVAGQPTLEVCDGVDNDCDQETDESDPAIGAACDSGLLGACAPGTQQCVGGALSCVPNATPLSEQCNDVDDDCNGVVDDNVPGTGGACSTGQLGVCSEGTISCQGGVVDCFPNTLPSAELCNNIDDDCNGTVDDPPGINTPCDTGLLGICAAGLQQCSGGVFGCVQQQQAQATDVCGDNLDNDCNGTVDPGCLYTFSGVQTNVPIATLMGWTQCYLDTYANNATALSTILTQCNKAKLLLGCRATGSNTLIVAANAPRLDVIFDTGTGNVTHNANGVGWYYNGSWSWGFAQQGDAVARNSCDTASINPDKRLCWHTGGNNINTGWRCGVNTGLNFVATYERLVFHAD